MALGSPTRRRWLKLEGRKILRMQLPSKLNLATLGAPEMLNCLAEGAYITDSDRRIIFWNKAAERITGWAAADVVGKHCADNVLCHVDKDQHQLCGREYCPLHRCMVTNRASETPLLVYAQSRAGRRIPVEVTVAPLCDAEGRVVGGVELFRDASESVAEMMRARVIQENALRCPLPEDPRISFAMRYVPRDMVGGDFYRVEHTQGSHYAVLAADVAGHGVSSALYTMQLRALWEDLRPEFERPARVFSAMNRRVRAIAPEEGYFASAVYLVLDAATGDITYARAGHPPALLIRANGDVDELEQGGPALGMVEDHAFSEYTAALQPGDHLLVYSDGAVEVDNLKGQELGLEGLKKLIPACLQPDGTPDLTLLEEKLLAYSGCVHLPDDITLIRVSRR